MNIAIIYMRYVILYMNVIITIMIDKILYMIEYNGNVIYIVSIMKIFIYEMQIIIL